MSIVIVVTSLKTIYITLFKEKYSKINVNSPKRPNFSQKSSNDEKIKLFLEQQSCLVMNRKPSKHKPVKENKRIFLGKQRPAKSSSTNKN